LSVSTCHLIVQLRSWLSGKMSEFWTVKRFIQLDIRKAHFPRIPDGLVYHCEPHLASPQRIAVSILPVLGYRVTIKHLGKYQFVSTRRFVHMFEHVCAQTAHSYTHVQSHRVRYGWSIFFFLELYTDTPGSLLSYKFKRWTDLRSKRVCRM